MKITALSVALAVVASACSPEPPMAGDPTLAKRVAESMAGVPRVIEQRMSDGVTCYFMVNQWDSCPICLAK